MAQDLADVRKWVGVVGGLDRAVAGLLGFDWLTDHLAWLPSGPAWLAVLRPWLVLLAITVSLIGISARLERPWPLDGFLRLRDGAGYAALVLATMTSLHFFNEVPLERWQPAHYTVLAQLRLETRLEAESLLHRELETALESAPMAQLGAGALAIHDEMRGASGLPAMVRVELQEQAGQRLGRSLGEAWSADIASTAAEPTASWADDRWASSRDIGKNLQRIRSADLARDALAAALVSVSMLPPELLPVLRAAIEEIGQTLGQALVRRALSELPVDSLVEATPAEIMTRLQAATATLATMIRADPGLAVGRNAIEAVRSSTRKAVSEARSRPADTTPSAADRSESWGTWKGGKR